MTGPRIPTEADRLQRLGAETALATADDWTTAPTVTPAAPVYTPAQLATGVTLAVDALERAASAASTVEDYVLTACAAWAEGDSVAPHVAAADLIRQAREALARAEAQIARAAGHLVRDRNADRTLALSDGRTATVGRAKDRKQWEHEDWKRDVRRAVLDDLPETLVRPDTGEAVNVPSLLASVQAAHGASAPKVTVLRELGLRAADYCEEVPGPWTITLA